MAAGVLSYTSQLKRELLQNKQWRSGFKKQLAGGLLYFSQHFSPNRISLTTMDEHTTRFYAALLPKLIALTGTITTTETENAGRLMYTVEVDHPADRLGLLNYFAMLYPEGVTFDLLGGETGTAAFLAGAFLACGSLADPQKKYHLEFALSGQEQADTLSSVFCDVGFIPRITERRGLPLIYFHDSRQLEDILTFLGCPRLSLEIMSVKILKERRNTANRAANCDNANIDKTVDAAATQVDAIQIIYRGGGEVLLPDELRELAALRLAEPELSLRELGQRLNPPLSRSGVNHRLERLVAIAAKIN